MPEEQEPVVLDEEIVLRRILNRTDYYDPTLPVPTNLAAFRPNASDPTGLSVFRERYVSPERVIAAAEESGRATYVVARLPVRELTTLGLRVVPENDPDLPGHAVIPELSWGNYQADKKRLKEVLLKLAILASRRIVRKGEN